MDAPFTDLTTESRGFKVIRFPIKAFGNDNFIDIPSLNTFRAKVSRYE